MDNNKELSPAGRAILFAGIVLGLVVGGAACFLLPVGILPGTLVGMAETCLGSCARSTHCVGCIEEKGLINGLFSCLHR